MDSHSQSLFYVAERRIRSVINEFPVSYYSLGNISIHKARRISSRQPSLAPKGDQGVTICLGLYNTCEVDKSYKSEYLFWISYFEVLTKLHHGDFEVNL